VPRGRSELLDQEVIDAVREGVFHVWAEAVQNGGLWASRR
jgi:hypothetical protein